MLSMYEVSVPVFQTRLKALSSVLAKAEANAVERKIDPAVFLGARLAPDMLSLTKQVQIATDHARGRHRAWLGARRRNSKTTNRALPICWHESARRSIIWGVLARRTWMAARSVRSS